MLCPYFVFSTDCLLFYWFLPLLYESFLVWCSPTCLFLLCVTPKISLPRLLSRSFSAMFSSRSFIFSSITFKVLLNYGWFYECCVDFCCVAKWFSYTYTLIHSFSDSLPIGYHGILSRIPCATRRILIDHPFHIQ